jgi:hypothetical protein
MKYLARFLEPAIFEDIPPGLPTKPTKPPSDDTPDFRPYLEGATDKTDETPSATGFVGFVGSSPQESPKIEPVSAWWDVAEPDVAEVLAAIGSACLPPGSEPQPPPRPDALPAYGLTAAGHVVELPRPRRDAENDPLRRVTGPGWRAWYGATPDDQRYVRNPKGD